jgi:predicted lipid-binding transport protein (Tim44 family)
MVYLEQLEALDRYAELHGIRPPPPPQVAPAPVATSPAPSPSTPVLDVAGTLGLGLFGDLLLGLLNVIVWIVRGAASVVGGILGLLGELVLAVLG